MGLGKFISGVVTGVSIASDIVGQSPQAGSNLSDQLSDRYQSTQEAKIKGNKDNLKTATDARNRPTTSGGDGKKTGKGKQR